MSHARINFKQALSLTMRCFLRLNLFINNHFEAYVSKLGKVQIKSNQIKLDKY